MIAIIDRPLTSELLIISTMIIKDHRQMSILFFTKILKILKKSFRVRFAWKKTDYRAQIDPASGLAAREKPHRQKITDAAVENGLRRKKNGSQQQRRPCPGRLQYSLRNGMRQVSGAIKNHIRRRMEGRTEKRQTQDHGKYRQKYARYDKRPGQQQPFTAQLHSFRSVTRT